MELLFWSSLAFIGYVYVGYPLLLAAWARVRRTLPRTPAPRLPEKDLPGVSVIVAVRDEAARVGARIENLLASDYPGDRLQVVVASDGSTDGTADVLSRYADRIDLVLLPPSGKAAALNAAVRRARHPVLVFADARQRFASDAIRRLVDHFADPGTGAVSGELMLSGRSTIGEGVGAYWSYEKWLRRREAEVGSTIGVTGAIYAMRRTLWQPLPHDTLLDDVLGPIRVVLRGYRVAFDGTAQAFDEMPRDAALELRRKTRTLAGNFQLVTQEPRLLVPGVNPIWVQFMSHKIGRLLVPYALVALFASSVALAQVSWLYTVTLVSQVTFYSLAAYGAVLDRRARVEPVISGVNREAA